VGPSEAIRKYLDRKISSDEYFEAVREEAVREVAEELDETGELAGRAPSS
jgi:hypothetical protein